MEDLLCGMTSQRSTRTRSDTRFGTGDTRTAVRHQGGGYLGEAQSSWCSSRLGSEKWSSAEPLLPLRHAVHSPTWFQRRVDRLLKVLKEAWKTS